ncbi:DUF2507 domain-containing protein [Fructilactobacillus florum]|uniref:DUF2507 domain-containing protein n=1 Tax=Fructilactobacillus florum TaxID=640331 RepID=UPI0006D00D27|nr:DUF2507 domain-containing protein [Fructilactobacillus florum]
MIFYTGQEKNLAIKFPQTTESLVHFFEVSDFGNLVLTKQTADKTTWKLSGPTISKRLAADQDADFMLETGFLAQTQQQTTGLITEAEYKLRNKGIIEIMVVSDSNQPLPY